MKLKLLAVLTLSFVLAVTFFTFPPSFSEFPANSQRSIAQLDRVFNVNTSIGYSTIQAAINAPDTLDGHVLFLDSVVFYEHIVVNKSVSLDGSIWLEHPEYRTVIDGNGTGDTLSVESGNVRISGIRITNGANGIYLNEADNCTIGWGLLEIVNNMQSGICLRNSRNCTILHSYVMNNHIGVSLTDSNAITVSENSITGNYIGVYLTNSSDNIIQSNNVTSNTYYGIWLDSLTSKTIVQGNYVADNFQGIHCYESSCITVSANMITDNYHGIFIDDSDDSVVVNNNITLNRDTGISSFFALNASIIGNDISRNKWCGVSLCVFRESIIAKNNVRANKGYGFVFRESLNNDYVGNNITDNGCGVLFCYWSENNSFIHNNFIDNLKQEDFVFCDPSSSPNVWDNGLEGNYWDDYNGTDLDHDGIGDSEYYANTSNTDHHPLMGAFSEFNATSMHHVCTICNSTISNFQFNGTTIGFNVASEDGTAGFCRICIPTALVNVTYKVFVNDTEVSCSLLPCSNSTHSYLYFNYTHSTQPVIIIPEFPSFLILPLLILATLFTTMICRKKKQESQVPTCLSILEEQRTGVWLVENKYKPPTTYSSEQ